ncbi:abscission/NoCut checkpoint regulator-like isoform X2 [Sycon ciliatum]|uniref:abscission/NoCut checkpoint regulator-like isoform X2 n=1 Tax=Sycon ciliatum TaxID=27933 RepID=UPI0031F5F78E
MPCSRCQQEFSLFQRSHGCAVCLFIFCSKCSNHWLKLDGEKQRVCEKCYQKLTNTSADEKAKPTPDSEHRDHPPEYTPSVTVSGESSRTNDLRHEGDFPTAPAHGTAQLSSRSPSANRAVLTPAQVQTIRNLPPSQRGAAEARLLAAASGQAAKPKKSPSISPNVDRRAFQHLPPSQRKAAESRAEQTVKHVREPQDVVLEQRLAELKQKPKAAANKDDSGGGGGQPSGTDRAAANAGSVSADDIEGRLARLMGVDKSTLEQKTHHSAAKRAPKMTADEEVDLLLNQTNEEVELDSILDAQDENLHARLGNLRTASPKHDTTASTDNSTTALSSKLPPNEDVEGSDDASADADQSALTNEAESLLKDLIAMNKKEQLAAQEWLAQDAEIMARVAQLSRTAEGDPTAEGQSQNASGNSSGKANLDSEVAKAMSMHETFGASDDDDDDDSSDMDDEGTGVNKLLKQLQDEADLDENLEKAGLSDALRSQDPPTPAQADQPPPSSAEAAAPSTASTGSGTGIAPADLHRQPPVAPAATANVAYHDPYRQEDELPWCCICNSNAVVRCLDCDADLYCKKCFLQGHREFSMHDHQIVKYRPPPKPRD